MRSLRLAGAHLILLVGIPESQKEFLTQLFEFYKENESEIEFLTWYRYSDRPDREHVLQNNNKLEMTRISVGGGSGLGSSEHVIERLNHYVCSAGLVDVNGNAKLGWNEFKNQVELLN